MNNQSIRLADGRNLGFAVYGSIEGQPVMLFHGMPGSRLELPGSLDDLREQHVRLVVADRPGYGLSDFQEDPKLLDWPDDVSQLAGELKLDRFAVVGFSGGGPHAAACACRMPDRLTRVAMISSPTPFHAPGVTEETLPAAHGLFESAANNYTQTRQQLDTMAPTVDAMMKMVEASLSSIDKPIFANESFQRMYLESLAETHQQGLAGFVWDLSLLAQPWGFELPDIKAKVMVWHGESDATVPTGAGRYLSDAIPEASVQVVPGAGHLLMFTHWQEILQSLTNAT